jgi:hypothetical protein
MLPLILRVLIAIGASMTGPAPQADDVDPRALSIIQTNPPMMLLEAPPVNPQPGDVWVIWPELARFVAVDDGQGGVAVLNAPRLAPGKVMQDFRLSEYVSFALLFILATTIAFQMPLVVLVAGWVGLASVQWLRSRRKYALFICGIVSAVVTPSADVVSMLVLLVPLYGLYELGILLLALAPASVVAEGRIFSPKRFWRTASREPDKRREPMDRPAQSAQTEMSVARRNGPEQPDEHTADGKGSQS